MARQRKLDKVEDDKDAKLAAVAETYRTKLRERMDLQNEERDAREACIALMHEVEIEEYTLTDGRTLKLVEETKEKLKITGKASENGEADEADNDNF